MLKLESKGKRKRIKLIGEFLLSAREYLVWLKSSVRRDRQSGIDIDMIQPDCLSVSFGYTKDQIVLGVPLGSPKTRYVPTGSQFARVRERASSWVPLFKTLMGSEGKGRGKLASDKEGFVTCHMGTQFCFRVYISDLTHKWSFIQDFDVDFGRI
uniref:Uncharacterized protein n=1 Tax=Cucumis melo TaxID=3656 RepID=A0A9I9E8D4_CUCME